MLYRYFPIPLFSIAGHVTVHQYSPLQPILSPSSTPFDPIYAAIMAQAHLRSLYRSILRELPPRPLGVPASPLRTRIRDSFAVTGENNSPEYDLLRRQEAEQFVQYVKAQRMYITLLERYNPGMSMDDEERVRLTAKRVGMEMPIEFENQKKP